MVNNWDDVDKKEKDTKDGEDNLCVNCHRRPRWSPHKFCSKECGRTCRLPDCWEKKFEGSLYCSQPHRKAAVTLGIAPPCSRCAIFPQEPNSKYCGKTCATKAASGIMEPPPSPMARSGTAHFPRPPSAFTRPRSAYQISFGSYKGEPNFLLRSKRGLAWCNLPSNLDKLYQKHNFADEVLDFSLGTDGKYYMAYKDGAEVKLATSKRLWDQLDEDFHGGSVRQIQFGAEGTIWGLKSYRHYNTKKDKEDKEEKEKSRLSLPGSSKTSNGSYVVREEPFGCIPDSLMRKSAEIYPDLRHYGQVDFVAVGMGGAWVIGVMGKLCFWDKMAAPLVKKMTRIYETGGTLRNVALSPVSDNIYLLEAKDGTVTYHVPDDWHAQMKAHFRPGNGLDIEPPTQRRPARPVRINPNVYSRAPPQGSGFGQGPPGAFAPLPPPYPAPSGLPPPAYSSQPPMYNPIDPNALYQTNSPSSGFIQAPAGRTNIGGDDVLVGIMRAAPAVLDAGVNLVSLANGGGGSGLGDLASTASDFLGDSGTCTIM